MKPGGPLRDQPTPSQRRFNAMNKLTARLQLEPQQRQSKTNGAGSAAGADQLIARLASGIEPERELIGFGPAD